MATRSRGREQAAALRQELGLGSGRVDPFAVLHRLGVEVYMHPFPDDSLDGAFVVREGKRFVFVNSGRSITRQRLTAAHELGHLRLDASEGDEVFEVSVALSGGDIAEQDAFRFARHFLLDPVGVELTARRIPDNYERVAAVASEFEVSPEVAAIQLADLRHIPARVKLEIQQQLHDGTLKPFGLLSFYGYPMARTPAADIGGQLDPAHVRRSMQAYRKGHLTLAGFADVVLKNQEEARQILLEAGIEPQVQPAGTSRS